MASTRQCPKCGVVLPETGASTCPACGTYIGTKIGTKTGPAATAKWVIALVQITLSTTFMLVFRFPKFMIAIFAAMIVAGTALSGFVKPKTLAQKSAPQRPLAHPALFKVLGLGIAICALAFVSSLLFGFVSFMNSWTRWHQYEGQRYHRSEFQVTHAYWQRSGKSYSVYASGIVEANREWMSLTPYLHRTPRSQAELDDLVQTGTSIPIYFFPDMKGRARVQVVGDLSPAEQGHRDAMNALNYGLAGLALSGGLLFVMLRLRNFCYQKNESAFGATA